MKHFFRLTPKALAVLLLSAGLSYGAYASGTNDKDKVAQNNSTIDLGCVTKQICVKVNYKQGFLIKSKRFLIYVNREDRNMLFVSQKISISKGNFDLI